MIRTINISLVAFFFYKFLSLSLRVSNRITWPIYLCLLFVVRARVISLSDRGRKAGGGGGGGCSRGTGTGGRNGAVCFEVDDTGCLTTGPGF